jgi:hypothetical protein
MFAKTVQLIPIASPLAWLAFRFAINGHVMGIEKSLFTHKGYTCWNNYSF